MERPEQFNFYTATDSSAGKEGGSKSNGAVIGGAVGGAVGGALIIGLIIFFLCRRKRSKQTARGETAEVATPMMDGKPFDPASPQFAAQSRKYLVTILSKSLLIMTTAPPTYSAPNGDYYQSMTSNNKENPYTQNSYQQQWAHHENGPQEMEADAGPSNRYSELPAEASRPGTHHNYAELSTDKSCRVSPQHSPKPSQTENSLETRAQGLGVVTESGRS